MSDPHREAKSEEQRKDLLQWYQRIETQFRPIAAEALAEMITKAVSSERISPDIVEYVDSWAKFMRRWELDEPYGRGGFGRVYPVELIATAPVNIKSVFARQTSEIMGPRAMKLVPLTSQQSAQEIVTEFSLQARLYAALEDIKARLTLPVSSGRVDMDSLMTKDLISRLHIPRIDRVFIVAHRFAAIVMESVNGHTLSKEISDKLSTSYSSSQDEDIGDLWNLLQQLVTFMHEQGVYHRDLKPENLMTHTAPGQRRHLWAIDFGKATTNEYLDPSETYVGTLMYMAPEMIRHAVAQEYSQLASEVKANPGNPQKQEALALFERNKTNKQFVQDIIYKRLSKAEVMPTAGFPMPPTDEYMSALAHFRNAGADLWGLGMIMYAVVEKKQPFVDDGTQVELELNILRSVINMSGHVNKLFRENIKLLLNRDYVARLEAPSKWGRYVVRKLAAQSTVSASSSTAAYAADVSIVRASSAGVRRRRGSREDFKELP